MWPIFPTVLALGNPDIAFFRPCDDRRSGSITCIRRREAMKSAIKCVLRTALTLQRALRPTLRRHPYSFTLRRPALSISAKTDSETPATRTPPHLHKNGDAPAPVGCRAHLRLCCTRRDGRAVMQRTYRPGRPAPAFGRSGRHGVPTAIRTGVMRMSASRLNHVG